MSNTNPGFQAIYESHEDQIYASGPNGQDGRFGLKATIDDSTVDAGNTPTTTLRHGFVYGLKASDGKVYPYDADANDGTQMPVGVAENAVDMLGRNAAAVDQFKHVLKSAILKDITSLIGYDLAVAASLFRQGFRNASLEPHGSMFGLHFKRRDFKNGTDLNNAYTVVAGDHGCMLVATTAAMTFTMPSLASVGRGFQVFIYNGVDANMVISAAANTILSGDAGGAPSTTITFSSANAKMGAHVLMYADYDGPAGSLAWYPMMVNRTAAFA